MRPYPDVASGQWQVSTGGGTRPLWSRNGQELFYVVADGRDHARWRRAAASWTATPPTMLIREGSVFTPPGNPGRTYDVSPDGERFLIVKPPAAPTEDPPQIVILQHFDQELKRLVPTTNLLACSYFTCACASRVCHANTLATRGATWKMRDSEGE